MNVALVVDTLTGGGAENVVRQLACGLARRRQGVSVYCLKNAGEGLDELQTAGVTVRQARSTGKDPLLAWRLLRWMRRDGIEVINAHSSAALCWALLPAKVLGVALIQTRHGVLLGSPSAYRRWADRCLPLTDHVIIVAEALRAQIPNARLARQATYLPNGIDRQRVPRRQARDELERLCGQRLSGPVVLSVGTICPEKDTLTLVEAFALLREDTPEAHLVCVGAARSPGYLERVRSAVASLGVDGRVHLPGLVSEAYRLMSGADVFCLSSATEAMPYVIIEAMSQNVPIVATTVGDVGCLDPSGGCRRMLLRQGETTLLVPPSDPSALARALRDTLKHPQASQGRADRARAEYTRRHTGEFMVRRYEHLYAACIRRCKGGSGGGSNRIRTRDLPGVLMVGPGEERIGGMASVIDALMASSLAEKYRLHRFDPTAGAPSARNSPADRSVRRIARLPAALARHGVALCRLARAVRREGISIVHIHTCSFFTFYRNLADLVVARLLGCRVYLHIHGGRFDEFCAGSGHGGRWLIRRACEAVDAVIVLSRRWLDALQVYLGDARVVAIPNGVLPGDRPVTQKRHDDGVCRFLYLGALTEQKGLGELIEAAGRMKRASVSFELTLTGPATDEERTCWQHLVQSRGLEQCVRITDAVRRAAKAELLASVDCLVLPSRNEGLPIVILEAAMAGVPVLATSVGSIPEFMVPDERRSVATSGRSLAPLVPPRDPAALAAEMTRLARDPELRRAIGARLQAHVAANYSVERQAQRVAELYALPRTGTERVVQAAGAPAARPGRSATERLAGRLTYPLHETLRRRPTLRYLDEMGRIAAGSADAARRLAAQRLRDLLCFASDRLPYYREMFRKHGADPRAADPFAELAKLPLLEKADIRANAEGMIDRNVPGGLTPCGSGGTTGSPLRFFIDRVRQAQPLACRLFMQGLFGVQPGDRRVYLWGSPIEARGSRFKRWRDRLISERMLDAFDMGPGASDAHLESIRSFRPRVIYAYPSAAALLARRAARRFGPGDFPWLRLVVLTGEEITADQVQQVRETFGCPAVSEYGSREVGLIAHECPHGSLHIMSPHVHVEVLAGGRAVPGGQVGEVICTTLTTRAQPFIRYRLGDVGALVSEACSCGLPFPRMRVAGGRITGFVVLPDGRLCHGAVSSCVLRDEAGIVEFKTFQRAVDRFEVLLVVDHAFDRGTIGRIQRRYRDLLGPRVNVTCRIVGHIPPDPSGKRRHVVSDVTPSWAELTEVCIDEPENASAATAR